MKRCARTWQRFVAKRTLRTQRHSPPQGGSCRSAFCSCGPEKRLFFVDGDARHPRPLPAEPGRVAARGEADAFVLAGIFLRLAGMIARVLFCLFFFVVFFFLFFV